MTTTRREFLLHSALGTLTFANAARAGSQAPPPIVDPHVHLWDLDRFRLPWIANDSPLRRNFVLRDYRDAIAGLNVVKGVYMEVDVEPQQHRAEAEYVLEICRQDNSPLVAAVIGGRPADENFRQYVQPFRDNRHIKGVRQVLHTSATTAGYCLRENFVRGVRLLGDLGMIFDLCMRPEDLRDAARLIEQCPDVRFVLDHCGNGPIYAADRTQWQRDMERVARFRNVVCKVSGVVVQARRGWRAEDLAPVINHTLRVFGPERVMFAGDWPVCTRAATDRQWVEALRSIVRERPDEQQRRLFHDNAVRFYGI